MLLQKLIRFTRSIPDMAPPMYVETPVRYAVDIDPNSLSATINTLTGPEGRRADRGLPLPAPTLVRSGAIKPKLLVDNGEYALGTVREDGDPEKVQRRHEAFVELITECLHQTRHQDVETVHRFLTTGARQRLELPEDFDPAQTVTFQVRGRNIVDDPVIQEFWANYMSPASDDDEDQAECLACGRMVTPVARLQYKIKGAPGGQPSGTSLISANASAFESYGLKASRVSPICDQCAEQFSKSLNWLIASEQHRLYAGGQLFVFWSESQQQFSVIDLLSVREPAQVREFLNAVYTGRASELQDTAAFHALSLSGSGGRLVVRDWIDSTVQSAASSLARYFNRQRIVQPDGSEPRPYGLTALARATVREQSNDDPAPLVPRALVRSALTGSPLPFWIIGQILRRVRAAQRVTGPQAALLKFTLLDLATERDQQNEERLMQLDQTESNAAYLCGRLFAVLDATQRAALGTRNATIIDRFFGTASSAPASIFGRLLRGAQPHLARLRRDRPGAYVALEQRMEEIMSRLGEFPRTLSMQDQARFVLGYYHQRAWDRAQAREASERRKRGEQAGAEAELADAIDIEDEETGN